MTLLFFYIICAAFNGCAGDFRVVENQRPEYFAEKALGNEKSRNPPAKTA
jgi:hypothetical protein